MKIFSLLCAENMSGLFKKTWLGHFVLGIILSGATTAWSQTLYYDRTTNSGWFAANMWGASPGTYNTTWSDGNIADFGSGSTATVQLSGNAAVAGLANSGSAITLQGDGLARTMTFSGGNVSGAVTLGQFLTFSGNFAYTGGGTMTWGGGSGYSAYAGTATVSGGTFSISGAGRISASSNFTSNGGVLEFGNSLPATAGAITVNTGGDFKVGRNDATAVSVTISSLQGTGGFVETRTNSNSVTNSLTVDQSTNTTYSGTIWGTDGSARLSFTKSGSGDLTLAGSVSQVQRTTTVNGGRLYINGNSTSFGDGLASTAIAVQSGGTLGGTGTITTLAGDSVVVDNGGKLSAGLDGAAGRTTYALGSGASLDLSAVSSATGWLSFELGADTTAGTTYDQIRLTSGTLDIGSGLLNFNDFSFSEISGFGVGTYTLFDSNALSGSLGSSLSGAIGAFNGTLSLAGSDVMLTVAAVPEPGTVGMLLLGAGVALVLVRRKWLKPATARTVR